MGVSKKEARAECPVDTAMAVLDGRWKGTILWILAAGPLRTSELRRRIPEISERMLIRHLQELARDGILDRTDRRAASAGVTYAVSAYGQSLLPVVQVLFDWGRDHAARRGSVAASSVGSPRPT